MSSKFVNLENLSRLSKTFKADLFKFKFYFKGLKVISIYSELSRNFLITIPQKNIAWFVVINSNDKIETFMPKEVFLIIKDYLEYMNEANNSNKHSTDSFFEALINVCDELDLTYIETTTEAELLDTIGLTKTLDLKYDVDGAKPFFKSWKINRQRNVSVQNLKKTEQVFGYKVADYCRQKNISSVWSDTPTEKSLDFLNSESALKKLYSEVDEI